MTCSVNLELNLREPCRCVKNREPCMNENEFLATACKGFLGVVIVSLFQYGDQT